MICYIIPECRHIVSLKRLRSSPSKYYPEYDLHFCYASLEVIHMVAYMKKCEYESIKIN